MKKKLLKIFIIMVALGLALTLTSSIQVQAALQANKNTQYTKQDTQGNWMQNFRKMEEAGGAMGLSESLNSDLTPVESNNIDVHMMRSTEYGAIAILSASGYGNPSNENAITTTTGNNTGVILNTSKWEFIAGGLENRIFSGIDSRYFDTYTSSQESARIGDGLGNASTTNPGTAGWHRALYSGMPGSTMALLRVGGGIFSFVDGNNFGNDVYYSRGVVVCGTGF